VSLAGREVSDAEAIPGLRLAPITAAQVRTGQGLSFTLVLEVWGGEP
jgi:hypothetical protein